MAEGPMEEAYMRFLSGEMDAFEIIVKELQMPLIHFINRYIGNTSIAEDLAEDVFVEILLHRDRYNFKVKLKTYLFTIARNTAIDYIRKNKRLAPYEVARISARIPGCMRHPRKRIWQKSSEIRSWI